jgi:hypothetical protein
VVQSRKKEQVIADMLDYNYYILAKVEQKNNEILMRFKDPYKEILSQFVISGGTVHRIECCHVQIVSYRRSKK